MGHSYGTFVGSRLVQQHRDRVHTLCLIDPVCFGMFMPHLLHNFIVSRGSQLRRAPCSDAQQELCWPLELAACSSSSIHESSSSAQAAAALPNRQPPPSRPRTAAALSPRAVPPPPPQRVAAGRAHPRPDALLCLARPPPVRHLCAPLLLEVRRCAAVAPTLAAAAAAASHAGSYRTVFRGFFARSRMPPAAVRRHCWCCVHAPRHCICT